jgi:hypothetical protein
MVVEREGAKNWPRLRISAKRSKMAAISDLDRNPFENLCKDLHDFDREELARLHEAAEEVKEILRSANVRQQRRMGASFKQIG